MSGVLIQAGAADRSTDEICRYTHEEAGTRTIFARLVDFALSLSPTSRAFPTTTFFTSLSLRRISSIVMLKESAPQDEEALILRQIVFERLNTGGIELERQEIRNAIYQGELNELFPTWPALVEGAKVHIVGLF